MKIISYTKVSKKIVRRINNSSSDRNNNSNSNTVVKEEKKLQVRNGQLWNICLQTKIIIRKKELISWMKQERKQRQWVLKIQWGNWASLGGSKTQFSIKDERSKECSLGLFRFPGDKDRSPEYKSCHLWPLWDIKGLPTQSKCYSSASWYIRHNSSRARVR